MKNNFEISEFRLTDEDREFLRCYLVNPNTTSYRSQSKARILLEREGSDKSDKRVSNLVFGDLSSDNEVRLVSRLRKIYKEKGVYSALIYGSEAFADEYLSLKRSTCHNFKSNELDSPNKLIISLYFETKHENGFAFKTYRDMRTVVLRAFPDFCSVNIFPSVAELIIEIYQSLGLEAAERVQLNCPPVFPSLEVPIQDTSTSDKVGSEEPSAPTLDPEQPCGFCQTVEVSNTILNKMSTFFRKLFITK